MAAGFLYVVVPAEAATYTGSATSYSACSSGSITATGIRPYFGIVASNTIPLGSTIELVHPRSIGGRRFFSVQDTGGPGFLTDFYAPSCGWAIQFGRRTVTVRTVTFATRARVTPVRARHSTGWGHVHPR